MDVNFGFIIIRKILNVLINEIKGKQKGHERCRFSHKASELKHCKCKSKDGNISGKVIYRK
jgi:hypothetical protein